MSNHRTVTLAPEDQQLKRDSKALIRAAGGQEASAEHTGSRQQRMSDVGLPNTDSFLTINEVAALEDITHGTHGHPIVTRRLARRQGFLLVAEPAPSACNGDLFKVLADKAKTHGALASGTIEAIGDGHLDCDEFAKLSDMLERSIELSAQMLSIMRAMHEQGKIT